MKPSIFLFLFILIVQFVYAQTEVEETTTKEPVEFTIVETMPSWQGCEAQKSEERKSECTFRKINEFIVKNLQYPENAKKNKTMGTVYVTFVIDQEGNVVNPKILRGVNDELDTEALRVINLMPIWNPGMQRGKVVQVQYNLPVKFSPSNR